MQIQIDSLHHQQRYILVRHAVHQRVLQYMRKGAVTDVVQQNGYHGCRGFIVRYLHTLQPERTDCFAHQMHRSYRMAETAVLRTGINQVGQAQLANTVQALHIGMLQHIIDEFVRNREKSKYRIVDNLTFISHIGLYVQCHCFEGAKVLLFFDMCK